MMNERKTVKRPLSDYSDGELDAFEAAYLKAKKTEGGVFSLAEIRLERLRRAPNPFGVQELAREIILHASSAADGLTTYGDLWRKFRPETSWQGNHSVKVLGSALGTVIAYCVRHGIPILTVLVVRGGSRELSERATIAIYEECKKYGVDVGLDPKAFVDREAKRAREWPLDRLPKE